MDAPAFLDDLRLSRDLPESLPAQLSRELRRLILAGTLPSGTRLPSARSLAASLNMARNGVSDGYAALVADGLLQVRPGSGTYVAAGLQSPTELPTVRHTDDPVITASARAGLEIDCHGDLCNPELAFVPGVPDLDAFPWDGFSRAVSRGLRDGSDWLRCADPRGLPELREAIAAHIGPSRGVVCHPDRVVILSSMRQGFEISTRLLSDPGDSVLVEDPGYVGAREIARALGRTVIGCPAGPDGLDLPEHPGSRTRLLFLTPTHHYPMGYRLTTARMDAFVSWSARTGVVLVEDDYDGEFSHEQRPARALAARPGALHRTIHMGTFSKSLFPGLRLAYAVVPETLSEAFAAQRVRLDGQSSTVAQAGLARFIRSGAYARHLRAMRSLYAARKRALLDVVETQADGWLTPMSETSGLHLCCALPDGTDDRAVEVALCRHGIGATALTGYALDPDNASPGLVIGFAGTEATRYPDLVARIVRTLQDIT